ncbi:hypothetical protein JCM12294_04970 [Desulfocicer niacini]
MASLGFVTLSLLRSINGFIFFPLVLRGIADDKGAYKAKCRHTQFVNIRVGRIFIIIYTKDDIILSFIMAMQNKACYK